MTHNPDSHPDFASVSLDPEIRARRLQRFLGPLVHEDEDQAEFWAQQSDAAHAQAGAELSDMAAKLAVQTGFGKDPGELFPGLSSFARRRSQKP